MDIKTPILSNKYREEKGERERPSESLGGPVRDARTLLKGGRQDKFVVGDRLTGTTKQGEPFKLTVIKCLGRKRFILKEY